MFNRLLVANRGEIACRIARTAHKMSIGTIGVYSEADKFSKHAQFCDQSFMIGPSEPQRSYLVAEHYLEIAKQASVDAIHPGYGFLSENADFVDKVEQNGYTFVGPSSSAIRSMGSKSEAKTIMEKAGVPILPGFHGADSNP
jgi:3-methylcrotonyl-CoA carboxylase alpha subunit